MSEASMLTIEYHKMSVRRTQMSTSHPTIPDRWNIMTGPCKFVSTMDARTWQVIEATKRDVVGVDRKGLVSASVYLIWTEPNSKVNRITYKALPFSIVCVDQKDGWDLIEENIVLIVERKFEPLWKKELIYTYRKRILLCIVSWNIKFTKYLFFQKSSRLKVSCWFLMYVYIIFLPHTYSSRVNARWVIYIWPKVIQ